MGSKHSQTVAFLGPAKTGRSNLLQSWASGEAKSKTGGWKVNRVVILQFNKPVAIVQVLVKSFAFFKLFRLNRGPLFLEDTYLELQEPVIRLLVNQLGDWKKGHLLSFAPEVPLSGKMLTMSEKQGIRQFTCRSWESIRFDQSESREILRNNLKGKWRNMLTSAERKGLRSEA